MHVHVHLPAALVSFSSPMEHWVFLQVSLALQVGPLQRRRLQTKLENRIIERLDYWWCSDLTSSFCCRPFFLTRKRSSKRRDEKKNREQSEGKQTIKRSPYCSRRREKVIDFVCVSFTLPTNQRCPYESSFMARSWRLVASETVRGRSVWSEYEIGLSRLNLS